MRDEMHIISGLIFNLVYTNITIIHICRGIVILYLYTLTRRRDFELGMGGIFSSSLQVMYLSRLRDMCKGGSSEVSRIDSESPTKYLESSPSHRQSISHLYRVIDEVSRIVFESSLRRSLSNVVRVIDEVFRIK